MEGVAAMTGLGGGARTARVRAASGRVTRGAGGGASAATAQAETAFAEEVDERFPSAPPASDEGPNVRGVGAQMAGPSPPEVVSRVAGAEAHTPMRCV